jgi:hypothetical protein
MGGEMSELVEQVASESEGRGWELAPLANRYFKRGFMKKDIAAMLDTTPKQIERALKVGTRCPTSSAPARTKVSA